jgi:uncharacterized protein (TIGR02118 family)
VIKIIFCLKRLPTLWLEAFHNYWLEKHAPLVREVAPILRIRRYTESHYFADPRVSPAVEARGSAVGPYDGVAELWWDSVEDIIAAGASPEGRASGRRLLADEKNFIDLANSPLFYSQDHEIIAAANKPISLKLNRG